MPLFDFICTACQKNFEAVSKSTDRLTLCPHCHSPRTKRLLSLSTASITKETQTPAEPASAKAACDHDHHTPTQPSSCENSYVKTLLQKHRR